MLSVLEQFSEDWESWNERKMVQYLFQQHFTKGENDGDLAQRKKYSEINICYIARAVKKLMEAIKDYACS